VCWCGSGWVGGFGGGGGGYPSPGVVALFHTLAAAVRPLLAKYLCTVAVSRVGVREGRWFLGGGGGGGLEIFTLWAISLAPANLSSSTCIFEGCVA